MIIVCNIWIICFELNWAFYDPSWMLQLSEYVLTLRSSVWVVFNSFLLLDATDRSKICSELIFRRKPIPFHFSWTLPLSLSYNSLYCVRTFLRFQTEPWSMSVKGFWVKNEQKKRYYIFICIDRFVRKL